MEKIKDTFIQILEKQVKEYTNLDVDIKSLPLDTPLHKLQLDSLTYIEAINDLEDKLGIEVPFSANQDVTLETIGDLLKLIDNI